MIAIFEYMMETACGRDNGNVRDADLGDARRLFCLLAIDILEKLASISQLELTFNGVKLIHTTHRNRLGKEKFEKLIKIWYNRRRLASNGLL